MKNTDNIAVFIGSSPSEWLPAKVLEFTIKKNTQLPVKVTRLCETGVTIPMPVEKKCRPKTPFSFQRFLIPALSGYKGKAIYLDADMLVFSDISELWNTDMCGNDILYVAQCNGKTKPQFSVMLMNTENLIWDINLIIESLNKKVFTYDELMYDFTIAKNTEASLNQHWNSLEKFSTETKLLHYTNMHTQPWVSLGNSHRNIWINELLSAINNGFISISDVAREIKKGNIRPSLILEISNLSNGIPAPKDSELEKLDANFIAPFRLLTQNTFRKYYIKAKIALRGILK